MKMKKKMLFAALLTAASFAVGCTVTPSSSTPISGTAPVSSVPSAPGSATEASSSAEASPELHLEYNPAILQCTIASDCAYVDASGTLHYYPEFLKTGDMNYGYDANSPVDVSAAPDGLADVRSVYRTWGMVYVLMQDGTVRGVTLHMQEGNYEKPMDSATEILKTIPDWKNVHALYPVYFGGGSYPATMEPAAFLYDASGRDITRLREFHDGNYAQTDTNLNPVIRQLSCGEFEAVLCDDGRVYTYAAADIVPKISEWEDIVQISMADSTLLALKSDGTLLQLKWNLYSNPKDPEYIRTDYPTVPKEYCSGVAQLFDCGVSGGKDHGGFAYIQLTDGTVFDCNWQVAIGTFPAIDQIFRDRHGVPTALTQDGQIIRLQEKKDNSSDFTDWLQSQTHLPATVGRK